MNAHFQTTQVALNDLVNFARTSTAEQMALGRNQVEDLTAVLRNLMTQINETAGSSVTQMAATLTAVVHDLSSKVGELGQQMTSAMRESAEKATGAATEVVKKADTWSSRNAEQLAELIQRHEGHLDRIEDVRATLDAALPRFKEAIGQYATVTADLRQISTQVSAIATITAGTTQTMKETQIAVQQVAGLTASQIERLAEANRLQQETWNRIGDSMGQYQQVFGQVEREASALLTQIAQHIDTQIETSRRWFEELYKVSNEHFANATQRLGASVSELDEYLQELTEVLRKARPPRETGV